MPRFTRQNELVLRGRFYTDDGTQPTSATATLRYTGLNGQEQTDTIELSADTSTPPVWSGTWNSAVCKEGKVDWVIVSAGPVIAAQQGFFYVDANKANV